MYNYYERTYYTLDDIRKALVTVSASYDSGEGPYALNNKSFSEFLNDCLKKVGLSLRPSLAEPDEAKICFKDYVWPRFYQEAIIYVDSDESEDFTEKYSLLIQNLKANKNKLLDDVKSASISRFNDTPQNSGDFSDDNHTSTVTKTENSSNVGTMMARLNEIEDNIKQLYIDWSNEFRKFIIWSVN